MRLEQRGSHRRTVEASRWLLHGAHSISPFIAHDDHRYCTKFMQQRLGRCATVEWGDLRVFLAIAREGTLGAAARRLGQTQPTMGRYRLFARSRRRSAKRSFSGREKEFRVDR